MAGIKRAAPFLIAVPILSIGVAVSWMILTAPPHPGQPPKPVTAAVELTAPVPATVDLKDMTWVEVRAALRQGYRTVLVPTGGIEQNGPHMILGKHDYLVGWAADKIAAGLGHTLVAPVMSYVPQGDYAPPTGHLRFAGTMGVSEATFAGLLEGVARSLKLHGFTLICFLGDHGGSQSAQRQVADRLSQEWRADGVRVMQVDAYYDDSAQIKALTGAGTSLATIGQHASIIDTAELLAVHPAGVDLTRVPGGAAGLEDGGGSGDPTGANVALGQKLIMMRVDAAIAAISLAQAQK